MSRVIDLSLAGKGNYASSASKFVQLVWFVIEACIVSNRLMPVSSIRAGLLRMFGAKIGKNCRFVNAIRVKFPWNLEVGDNSWFGEDVWIHNQALIRVGSNVCLSQGAFLTAGSHDFDQRMDVIVAPIIIEDGAWITSNCVIQQGVTIGRSALVTPLSVVNRSLEPNGIYGGNPCRFIRKRFER